MRKSSSFSYMSDRCEVQADVADEDDAALLPRGLHRLSHDLVALGRGGDEHGVGAEAVRQLVRPAAGSPRRRRSRASCHARAPSRPATGRGRNRSRARRGAQQLDGELAEDAEPHHGHRLAERRLRRGARPGARSRRASPSTPGRCRAPPGCGRRGSPGRRSARRGSRSRRPRRRPGRRRRKPFTSSPTSTTTPAAE